MNEFKDWREKKDKFDVITILKERHVPRKIAEMHNCMQTRLTGGGKAGERRKEEEEEEKEKEAEKQEKEWGQEEYIVVVETASQ